MVKVGIKQVYVSPDVNYGCAVHADKWIPILPNTDAAMQLAIAYTWITEGTYDKDYVKTHTVGFDKFSDYVLGKEDGVPKTPAWASGKCSVPEWTIKALARDWAKKITSVVHYYGGPYIRGPYSHEPARLEVCLLGMQGLGKPGIHQYHRFDGLPANAGRTYWGTLFKHWRGNRLWTHPKQLLPKTLIQEAILNPPVTFYGTSAIIAPTEDQLKKYVYPIPKEEGGSEIHMIWTDTPCRVTCWNEGNKTVEAFRSPKIECVVAQHPWLENDCLIADLILPASTKFEQEDIASSGFSVPLDCFMIEHKCIDPVGESMSDYEVVGEVAKKLGKYEEYTEGKSIPEWIKSAFDSTHIKDMISWEDINKKGFYVIPSAEGWENVSPGLRKFYEDPEKNPLETPSGKLEFYSQRLAENFPDDMERPPVPHWVEKGPNHDERLSSSRAEQYPLLIMSNHGRWRVHAQGDDIKWTREVITCKVRAGTAILRPIWINPADAKKRGIQTGDIIKVFNERGIVLTGALVWERVMPGVVYVDHGARVDPILPGKIDRGGAINLITPYNTVSKNCPGMAESGFLVEVAKVDMAEMEDWKKQYPEAWQRAYEPAAGLRFNSWIEGAEAVKTA